MARFVPAHQHAFMSLLVFVVFVGFVGYMVWSALHGSEPEQRLDAGP